MGRKKIYTEEELKERRRKFCKKWRENNKEYQKKYYQSNKEKLKEYQKESYQKNKDIIKDRKKEYNKEYYQSNKEKFKEKIKEWRETKNGRASYLLVQYKRLDKKYNRGECTLTKEWIIENIFNKSCVYCGESDWTKLGCDRKDNTLPHTEDNCVPCCFSCNTKKGTKNYNEYMKQINQNKK